MTTSKTYVNAHDQIAIAVKREGVSAIAKRLGVDRGTLLTYVAEACRTATREMLDRKAHLL